jgi:hypothetical protein
LFIRFVGVLLKKGRYYSRRAKGYARYLVFLAIIVEIACRTFFSVRHTMAFWRPDTVILGFYPELAKLSDYKHNADETSVLVLGGSVVFDEDVAYLDGDKSVVSSFCKLDELLHLQASEIGGKRYRVYSLAQPAHNSLDSWYKYKYLRDKRFDYVVVYHGINDARANNCPSEMFDQDYRMIAFYDELYVFERHPEINIFFTPYVVDRLGFFISRGLDRKRYIPREPYLDSDGGSRVYFTQFGGEVKSAVSFERNLRRISDLANRKGDRLVLLTFAYYVAPGYTLEKFRNRELDYTEQLWPTELYGRVEYVADAIEVHNEIIRHLGRDGGVLFADLDAEMPKSGKYFNDICHLSQAGCGVMSGVILKALGRDAGPGK